MSQVKNSEQQVQSERAPLYMLIVSFLKPLYTIMGADAEMVYLIVKHKFLIDSRKDNPLEAMTGHLKEDSNAYFKSLWVYTIMGAFLLFTFRIENRVYHYSVFFFFLFIMLIATLISQFSTVLLDLADQTFLGSKPVSNRTLLIAKAVHVGIYVISFSLSLSIFFVGGSFVFNGFWVGLLTLGLTLIATLWSYILTTLLYAVALVHLDGEKLKNLIAYTQIALMAFTVIAYQILGQLYNLVDLQSLSLELNGSLWNAVLFPLWFVAPIDMLSGVTTFNALLTGLLILSTFIILIGYFYYGDYINQNLQNLNTDHQMKQSRSFIQRWAAKLLCVNQVEITLFHYSWNFLREDREFKTRLYPSMISAFLIPFILIYSIFFSNDQMVATVVELGLMSYIPYMTLLIIPNVTLMMQFSKQHQASWQYGMLPIKNWSIFIRAAYKSVLVRVLSTIYVFLAFFSGLIAFGEINVIIMINGWLITSIATYLAFYRIMTQLPFTKQYDPSSANFGCLYQALSFVCVILVGLLTAAIQQFIPFGESMLLIILILGNVWIFRKGFKHKIIKVI